MDLKNLGDLPPDVLSKIATLVQAAMPVADQPKQVPRVTCYDASTGQRKELYRIDFNEQAALGLVVTDLSQVKGVTPQRLAQAAADAGSNEDTLRATLDSLDIEPLRARWKVLHPGEDPHPRLGKTRLIEEILEAQAKLAEQANAGAGDTTTNEGEPK